MLGRPKGRRPTMVYVAQGLTSGVYKVGCTNSLARRAAQLANHLDEPVAMLAAFPGSYSEEFALIQKLAAFRATAADHPRAYPGCREYFSARGGMLASVVEALPACDVAARPPARMPEAQRRARFSSMLARGTLCRKGDRAARAA